jgi:hypothetical protein
MKRGRGERDWVGLAGFCAVLCVLIVPTEAASQKPDRRTVFRCETAGHISYSDAPCPDAEKIDPIRLRGVNPPTAPNRMAYRAPADRPPSDPVPSYAVERHTARFGPGVNPECPHLAQRMALVEAEERSATAHTIATLQERLAVQRHWYKQLGCAASEQLPVPATAPAQASDPLSAYGYAG